MVQQQIVTHASKSITFTAYDIKWVPSSARFVSVGGTARGSGTIKTWSLNNNEISLLYEIDSPASFKCATFGGSTIEDRHLTTGDFNGNLAMWDLAAGKGTRQFAGHSEIVNSIDGCGGLKGAGATEIASVSRDGQVKVWDVRQKEAVCSFSQHSSTSQTQEDKKIKVPDCWAVAFGNAYDNTAREVAAGYATGELVLYDLRTRSLRWSHKLPNGICSIQFDRKDIAMNKMIVTTLDGKFHVFDMRTFHSKRGYSYLTQKAHDSTVWTAQHSPFNRDLFITSGGNGAINLYQYTYPSARSSKDESGEAYGEMGKLTTVAEAQVADQPVISYDWHPDKEGLACGAVLDQTIKIFVAPKLHLL